MNDTEMVEVWSRELKRKLTTCKLAVGTHGLPVLLNQVPPMQVWEFPASWMLLPDNRHPPGTLLAAWRAIEDVMTELAEWQRRHDSCGKEDVQNEEVGP